MLASMRMTRLLFALLFALLALLIPTTTLADDPVELEGEGVKLGRMTVLSSDISLPLGDGARYKGADYRVVQLLSVLLDCRSIGSLMIEAEQYVPLVLIWTSELPSGEPTCRITFLALDHRTGRTPMPGAPGLHGA
jgi:hypothetical protein